MALVGFTTTDLDPKWKKKRYKANDDGFKADLLKFAEYFGWERKDLAEKCKKMGMKVAINTQKAQFLEFILKDTFKEILG